MMRVLRLAFVFAMGCGFLRAQQAAPSIGTVGVQDATVSGDLSVTNGRAVLVGSSNVTAKDHTAEIALSRGGTVRVCATSGLHLTRSPGTGAQPLMLALDRGAIEVFTVALTNDVVMTPDLRFTVRSGGPLDLRMRVTKNGDTCVENSGAGAPVLGITDQFGEATYELRAGQHVLFEHGSLKEVVDHESSPCGCPAAAPGMSVAEALLSAPGSTGQSASVQAAEQHPFPAAVSQGLAAPQAVPQAPAGVAHAQVATTLSYKADAGGVVSGTPAAGGTVAGSASAAPQAPAAAPAPGFGHRIGRFFKRLFGRD